MEAALRTVYEVVTGRELPFEKLHVTPIVGLDQIKTAELTIKDAVEAYKFLEGVTVKSCSDQWLEGCKNPHGGNCSRRVPLPFYRSDGMPQWMHQWRGTA